MPRALIVIEPPVRPEPFRLGLLGAGVSVVDEIEEPQRLMSRAVAIAPDIVLIASDSPSDALLEATRALDEHAPFPLLLYLPAQAGTVLEQALMNGIHHVVTQGFSGKQLSDDMKLAQAQFKARRELKDALREAEARLEERKLIDRAKGILMQSRHMSEDAAYSALRTLAMEKKLKIGVVAEQVINAARLLA
jgi:two-component system, response regulator / RNA-binding antiterminator